MKPRLIQWLPLSLVIISLLFAASAQRFFDPPQELRDGVPFDPPPQVFDGLVMATLGAISLVAARQITQSNGAMSSGEATRREQPEVQTPATARPMTVVVREAFQGITWFWGLTIVAALITIGLLIAVNRMTLTGDYRNLVWPWLISVILMGVAWLVPPQVMQQPVAQLWARSRAWLMVRRWEVAAVVVITLLAFGLRFWGLENAPQSLSGNEASVGLDIRRAITGDLRNPFGFGWGAIPALSHMIRSLPARVLGLDIFTARLGEALLGSLAIPALYLLARQLFDRRVALAAAALLATYHFHLHYSRTLETVAGDTFFFTATLAALVYGLKMLPPKGERVALHPWPFALAGLLAGLDQYSHSGARLLPFLILVYLAYLAVVDPRRLAGRLPDLGLMVLTFLIVASPLYLYAYHHADEYNSRLNQVGIFQSGWLESAQTARNEGLVPIMWDQWRRTLFGFAFFPDQAPTYGPGTPLASAGMAVFLLLGVGFATWRLLMPRYALVAIWFWSGILAGGMLTINPPTSNRLMGVTPAVALLTAIGINTMARLLVFAWRPFHPRLWSAVLVGLVTLALMGRDVNFYFRTYLPSNSFGGNSALVATVLGRDLAARSGDSHLYFFAPPRIYSTISPLTFLVPGLQATDINAPVSDPGAVRALVQPGADAVFVVLPERRGELDLIQAAYPNHQVQEVYAPGGQQLLYYLYVVPQSSL